MGYNWWPVYGEDIASAIQDVEKVVSKIKTNKFDKKDLIALVDANNTLIKHLLENENKE